MYNINPRSSPYKLSPAYTYQYQSQSQPYTNHKQYPQQHRQSPQKIYETSNNPNKLHQLNQRLSLEIEEMRRRNQWKREKALENGLRGSWGSGDRGRSSRMSSRSWDRKNDGRRYNNPITYQTDTESLTGSRASTQILNRPVITHTNSSKQRFANSPSFRQKASSTIQQIQRKPILRSSQNQYQNLNQYHNNQYHSNQNQYQYQNRSKLQQPNMYEYDGKKYGNFNKTNQHYQHRNDSTDLPYFKKPADNFTDSKDYRPRIEPQYPKQQNFEQFLDMNMQQKRQSLQSIPSQDFQDFNTSRQPQPQPQGPYSPMTLILPNKKSSQKLAPAQILPNRMPIGYKDTTTKYENESIRFDGNDIKKKNTLMNKISGIIVESSGSYDGKYFIWFLIGVGLLLVVYQLIR